MQRPIYRESHGERAECKPCREEANEIPWDGEHSWKVKEQCEMERTLGMLNTKKA